MMTAREWLKKSEKEFLNAGIADASSDAWLLFASGTGMSRLDYSLAPGRMLTKEQEDTLERYKKLRLQRIPVQQILHEAWFMGYSFYVNEHVLIPRQDTEVLIEAVLERINKIPVSPGSKRHLLDLCTGSGCILISLLKEEPSLSGTAADLSCEALDVARKNARDLDVEAQFVQGDLFENINDTFDVIVSNPPYIASEVIGGLDAEVKDHEPEMALDGGADGLMFYRRILDNAGAYLHAGGLLAFEIGYDQGPALSQMFRAQGFKDIEILKDLAGLDRVALGWK